MIEHHMRVRILPLAQPRLLYVCMYEFSYLSAHCFPIFIPLSIWPRVIKEMNYVAGRDSGTPFHCSEIYSVCNRRPRRGRKKQEVGRFDTWVLSSRVRLAASDKTRRYIQPLAFAKKKEQVYILRVSIDFCFVFWRCVWTELMPRV